MIADDDAYLKTSAANTPSNVPIEVARSPTNNRSGGITPTDLLRLKSYPFPEANKQNVKTFLNNYNWPPGLQQALLKSVGIKTYDYTSSTRKWICSCNTHVHISYQ